jgi:hypothetical protein
LCFSVQKYRFRIHLIFRKQMGNDASKVPAQGANDANSQQLHDTARQKEISRMDSLVRGRLRGTTTYNMKIVIRGDKGTGKTNLWRRLQGQSFSPNHIPTPEIQSATISWNFKSSTEEIAKVQIWDVVDQALLPADTAGGMGGAVVTSGNKKPVTSGAHRLAALDASTLDVYNNTDCVMFLINPLHRPSMDYVRTQAAMVPHTVAILLIVNFRDRIDTGNDKTNKAGGAGPDDDDDVDDDVDDDASSSPSAATVSLDEVGVDAIKPFISQPV